MHPYVEYQSAVRAFDESLNAPEDVGPTKAEIERLRARARDTTEGAAAKLACAAAAIEGGTFIGADALAERTADLAATLARREQDPALAARLRRLLAECERSAALFGAMHGYRDGSDALDLIRTALAGLTRPRIVG